MQKSCRLNITGGKLHAVINIAVLKMLLLSALILNVVLCVTATKPFISVHNYTCLVHTANYFMENGVESLSLNVYSDSWCFVFFMFFFSLTLWLRVVQTSGSISWSILLFLSGHSRLITFPSLYNLQNVPKGLFYYNKCIGKNTSVVLYYF